LKGRACKLKNQSFSIRGDRKMKRKRFLSEMSKNDTFHLQKSDQRKVSSPLWLKPNLFKLPQVIVWAWLRLKNQPLKGSEKIK
jgi:hypothetical protein